MEVTIKRNKNDNYRYSRDYYLKAGLWFTLAFIIIVPINLFSFFINIFQIKSDTHLRLLLYFSCLILCFAGVYLLPVLLIFRKLKKQYVADSCEEQEIKVAITNEGLQYNSISNDAFYTYNSIGSVDIDKEKITINVNKGSLFFLPVNSFKNSTERNNFFYLLRKNWYLAVQEERTSWPWIIYKIQWAVFIPFIGGLAGLLMIAAGLKWLKDKSLIWIGLVGIMITMMSYPLKVTKTGPQEQKKVGESIPQLQLNRLVKDIEFYRMQNGEYPDSLKQITKNDRSVNIYDIFSRRNSGTKILPYQYHKIRNKYTLYSVGIDGKPGTADDIYPNITNYDTSKFGLIISR